MKSSAHTPSGGRGRGIDKAAVPAPIAPSERFNVVDALRGFALLGIFLMNLRSFTGWNAMSPEAREAFASPTDLAALFLHDWFLQGKFYTLFSLLFGIGFAIQLTRGQARGGEFLSLYRRRLWVLLLFGLLHMTFLWEGDILALYAVCGFVLLLFRDRSDRTLLAWAVGLVLLPIPMYALMLLSGGAFNPGQAIIAVGDAAWARLPPGEMEDLAVLARGGWRDILYWNLVGPFYRIGGLIFEGRAFKVLGVFLIGLWAGRRLMAGDLLADRRLLHRVLIAGVAVGVPANLAFAWLQAPEYSSTPTPLGLVQTVVYAFGVVPLGLAYAAGFALLWQRARWKRALGAFAPAGRLALSTYLAQTLIGISFYGIGFGIVGKVGPALWTALGVAIFAAQVIVGILWLRYFRYGPAEWLWRRLTYRAPIRLRCSAAAPLLDSDPRAHLARLK